MFTRRDIMNIKPGSAAEVGRIVEDVIIPPLRGQKGLRHDDTFISPVLSLAFMVRHRRGGSNLPVRLPRHLPADQS